mmetsp:Transcript_2759/g.5246  ORF Transcript_2759/g.5246 Transcript_2759/m.5246 type:complete len:401 (+) Transcript_2759:160-1362(+)
MVDIHLAPVIHVEHIQADGTATNGNKNRSSNQSNDDRAFSCASVPPPTRSTRDLSISNTSSHCRNSSHNRSREKEYDTVRITAVTERDFSQHDYQERLAAYSATMGNPRNPESDGVVQLLALQVYHLPGNSWAQDWLQYMNNNHPVFGICCHSKLHPIGARTRIVALIGTIIFGLALTNMFYLFYLWNPEFDRVLATVVTDSGSSFVLTTGMLLLWTLGGGVHCACNLAMWHVAACACCRSGGCCESYACCPSLGKHMLRVFVLGIVGLCVMIVLLRVAINEQKDELTEYDTSTGSGNKGIDIQIDDQLDLDIQSPSEFSFLIGYLVEIVLSLFVYYPIGGTMLFSGIFACGFKIPVLGGRPYEVACEERRKAKQQQKQAAAADVEQCSGRKREAIEVIF